MTMTDDEFKEWILKSREQLTCPKCKTPLTLTAFFPKMKEIGTMGKLIGLDEGNTTSIGLCCVKCEHSWSGYLDFKKDVTGT
ncbi:hypothetical protein LCGC14_1272140 [marine sediment metagenome]|uniref:Uncharacterized protein n=1 Tax=marine sediment metagenome TaxID=412755 RepID=A0A0F9LIW6_9ZZZZ